MAVAHPESVLELDLVSEFLKMKLSSDIKVNLIDENEKLVDLVDKLKSYTLFAFDCESVGLGRNHPISLMNLAFEDGSIYLVDVQKLGFPDEFHSILSDPDIKKVMFDCRADADCLKHQHEVMLRGVIDMQIMEYVIRYPNLQSANKLPAFYELFGKYLNEGDKQYLIDLKPNVKEQNDWGIRPLKESLLKYASFEISCFLPVKEALMELCSHAENKIAKWSTNYAASRRDDPSFDQKNPYKAHRFMPLHIVDKPWCTITGPGQSFNCTGCGLELPRDEFSKTQLKKKVQKCKLCKAIKLQIDRKYERSRMEDFDERYDFSDDDLTPLP